jgi:hypothetical protein
MGRMTKDSIKNIEDKQCSSGSKMILLKKEKGHEKLFAIFARPGES